MSLESAFRRVFQAREYIRPNPGFWQQLRDLEVKLGGAHVPPSNDAAGLAMARLDEAGFIGGSLGRWGPWGRSLARSSPQKSRLRRPGGSRCRVSTGAALPRSTDFDSVELFHKAYSSLEPRELDFPLAPASLSGLCFCFGPF